MEQLLTIRKLLKGKKPTFTRHDAHKKKRVGIGWRRPKGRQNKMRLHRKGYAKIRSTGYGSPVAVKGLSKQGLTQNVVANLKDFQTLDAKKDGIIISGTVGARKKIVLIEFAEKNNFTIINLDAKATKKSIEDKVEAKKARRKVLLKRKDTKKKAKEKAAAKDDAEAKKEEVKTKMQDTEKPVSKDVETEKEAKLEEKKEHDKVLIRKE